MAAAASGADEIIAIDRVDHRLKLALELGATHAIVATGQKDLVEVVTQIIDATHQGADVALDTTGNPEVILAAVESLATHGTASVITSSGAPVAVPPGALLLVRNYPFADVSTAIADSLSSATIKPVLTFG